MVGTSEHCLRTVEIYPKNRALSVVRLTQSGSRLSLLPDIKLWSLILSETVQSQCGLSDSIRKS